MAKRRIPLLNRVLVAKAVPPSEARAVLLLPEKITKCDYGVVVGTEVCDKNGNLNPVKNDYSLLLSEDHGWTELKLRDKRSNCIGFPTLSETVRSSTLKHGERLYSEGSNINSSSIQLKSYTRGPISLKPVLWSRYLSSKAGANSGDKEDDLEDGFSDLEVPLESVDSVDGSCKEDDEELISEGELSEEYDESAVSSLDLVDVEASEGGAKKERLRLSHSPIFQIIMDTPRNSLTRTLDKYVEEGKSLGRDEISLAVYNLRKRRVYPMALQFVEWLEASKKIEFVERDYASHLDLIAKVNGLQKAEKYIDKIPECFRNEVVYGALLANYVAAVNVKKAEEVFDKIRDLHLPITAFACNQLLLLYKRVARKKIADVLFMMEKENIKPTLFTYKILVDVKGTFCDISGIEQIMELMKSESVEPDLMIKSSVAKAYVLAGLKEKAEAALKEIESDGIQENRYICKVLLPLYAALGKADDVARIWKVCDTKPYLGECIAAIVAWGKLGQIEKAEEVFEKMVETWNFSSKYYGAMLKVYANHKLLAKGKELVNRMSESRYRNGPFNWNALVNFYVESGEVQKADLVLHEAFHQSKIRPLYGSFITVMNQYAKRGDIHNAEKIFHMLKQFGYASRVKQYQSLLQTYVNAKTPAYGFLERMKADNMFPNKAMSAQLMANDALRKSLILKLLD
ncbi:pentatricopeptide repeat-containing protein At1g80270, mitochondrial-like [Zingiber officinale]|uniref:pentatricopeptide repeat-containing protein At1g80270, mitochondrial-like n=1 Tax=Zingiber officinale TaxID=94328 RepID=UPI001C4DA77C|nr:pentatricopeptide repeat-containing protein At1g80270, mitochondrial-like [Zingiber officinale]